jgi:hypothetical protein
MLADTCLGFNVACGTLFKGGGVVLAGFILFTGSVYVLLAAVFGRWMGYLVLMIAFSGWMIIQSSIWMFGFWSQGPDTKTNLGPRGSEPAWQVIDAGLTPLGPYPEFSQYPSPPTWNPPDPVAQAADIQSVQGAATTFLANQANATLGRSPDALDAIQTTQFAVDSLKFAKAADGTPIAVAQAHFVGGGPRDGAVDELQQRQRPAVLADVPRRLDPAVRDPSAAPRSSRAFAEGVPHRGERSSLVRAGIGGK